MMKKTIINISLILLSLHCFSQAQKIVKLDSLISVKLPGSYVKTDTLGQQNYTASSLYGYIIVSRSPNPPTNQTLKKEKDLNNIFKEYISKIQASLKESTVINNHDTIINKLEVRDFTMRTDTGAGVQFRKFRILYTKPVTYTFQYLYNEETQEVAAKEMAAFFNGIKSPPELNGADQYLTFGKWQGFSTVLIVLVIVGIIIVAFIIIMVRRKRNQDAEMQDFTGK